MLKPRSAHEATRKDNGEDGDADSTVSFVVELRRRSSERVGVHHHHHATGTSSRRGRAGLRRVQRYPSCVPLRCVDVTTTVEDPHLTSHATTTSGSSSSRRRLLRAPAAAQHRRKLSTKTLPGQTVEVEVDGVVDVHQQEADGLDE